MKIDMLVLLLLAMQLFSVAGVAEEAQVHLPAQVEAAKGPAIPPGTGYLTVEIADGVYWLTDGHYQMMFLTTGSGVIAVDAPSALGERIRGAIAEVTTETVTHIVYSHFHKDHIGAANRPVVTQQAGEPAHHAKGSQRIAGEPMDYREHVNNKRSRIIDAPVRFERRRVCRESLFTLNRVLRRRDPRGA